MRSKDRGKPIGLEEQKRIELEILRYVDELCRKNGIRYSLDGGTLLGAVRHKGYIPWDDDVDVILLRSEYDRLISLLEKDDKYFLLKEESEDYYLPFAKLIDKRTCMVMNDPLEIRIPNLGVYIDLFPADGCPAEREEQNAFRKKLNRELLDIRTASIRSYFNTGTPWKNVVKSVLFFPVFLYYRLSVSPKKRKERLLRDMRTYDAAQTGYAGFLLFECENQIMPASYFTDLIEMEFEGCSFLAMRQYDTYLKGLYNDYMVPPPPEERMSEHRYTPYYK